jgi:hypothetical protein
VRGLTKGYGRVLAVGDLTNNTLADRVNPFSGADDAGDKVGCDST